MPTWLLFLRGVENAWDKSTTKISMTFREEKIKIEKIVGTAVWNLIQKLYSPLNKHKAQVGEAFKRTVIL